MITPVIILRLMSKSPLSRLSTSVKQSAMVSLMRSSTSSANMVLKMSPRSNYKVVQENSLEAVTNTFEPESLASSALGVSYL